MLKGDINFSWTLHRLITRVERGLRVSSGLKLDTPGLQSTEADERSFAARVRNSFDGERAPVFRNES